MSNRGLSSRSALLLMPEVNIGIFSFLLSFPWEMWQIPFYCVYLLRADLVQQTSLRTQSVQAPPHRLHGVRTRFTKHDISYLTAMETIFL